MRTGITVLLVAGICLLALGTGILLPVAADDGSGGNGSINETADDVKIDSAVATATGETTVIVQLEERPTAEVRTTATDDQVTAMQSHASNTQTAFERFAEGNPHVEIERQFWITNAISVTVDTDKIPIERLGMVDHVTGIRENAKVEVTSSTATAPSSNLTTAVTTNSSTNTTTTADSYATTYGVEKINATGVWDTFGTKGEGAKVAVLDTGYDPAYNNDIGLYTRDESDPTYPGGWAEFESDGTQVPNSEPHDSGSHGTHVSGTVAGGNVSGEYIGVAPNADLMHGLVLPEGGGRTAQIIGGIEWAVAEDADVVSMSLGSPCDPSSTYDSMFIDPILNAQASGTTVVAATGNDGEGCSGSPGNVYDTIGVGASGETDDVASFSSGERIDTSSAWYNPPQHWPNDYVKPDIVAPGVRVKSAYPDSIYDYAYLNGTSMATPHVAGAVALLQSGTDEDLSPAEVRRLLETTAVDIGEAENRQGKGRIDVGAALLKHSRENADPTITPREANVLESTTIRVESDHPVEEYRWEFGDGYNTTTTSSAVEHTFADTGETHVSVELVYAESENHIAETTIDVVDVRSPTATVEANQTQNVEAGIDTVEFNASESTDNYEIDRYRWKINGSHVRTTNESLTEFTFGSPGNRTVALTVIDTSGNENTTTVEIEVVDTTVPTVAFEAPNEPIVGTEATFNATGSTDNHEINQYEWTFGNESPVATGDPVTTYEFEELGEYTVTLNVTDPSGNVNTLNDTVTVRNAPSATIQTPSDNLATNNSNLTVEYELADTDLENTSKLQYQIRDANDEPVVDWTDGPFERTEAPQQFAVHTGELSDGNYTISIRLLDGQGSVLPFETATDDHTITVKATDPALTVDVQPADEQYPSVGQHNPAVINVTATDHRHESTIVTITGNESGTINEWDLSNETGGGEVATVEWSAINDSGSPIESGSYEVSTTTTDDLGNSNTSSAAVEVDTDAPNVSVDSIHGTTNHDGDVYLNGSTNLTVSAYADDGQPNAIDDVSVSLEAAFTNYRHEVTVEKDSANSWTGTIAGSDLPDEGRYYVRTSATDAANNTNETVADPSVTIDRTGPEMSTVITDFEGTTATVRVRSNEPLESSPALNVTAPDGNITSVENLTEQSSNSWTGSFAIDDAGSYELTATGVDLAENLETDTTSTTAQPAAATDNRTVTITSERTGAFVRLNTTEDVDESSVTLSETRTPPQQLEADSIGVNFLTTVLGDELKQNLSNATIGIPVEQGELPDTVTADSDQVGLQWYNESGNHWEKRNLTVREFKTEDGDPVDGEYWIATVGEFSTYGVTVTDDQPPELVDATPADGATLDHDTETVSVELAYNDTISGINTSAINLSINKNIVTDDEQTRITSSETVYENLSVASNESYDITLDIADKAGNEHQLETRFEVAAEQGDDDDDNGGGGGGGQPPLSDEGDNGPDHPEPTAMISIDPDPATVGEEISISAAKSTDEERDIVAYDWEIDGEMFTGKTVTTSFDEPDIYDVELTVDNDLGESDTVTDTVAVEAKEDPTDDDSDGTENDSSEASDDTERTSDGSDGSSSIPGFGVSVALVALLSFAMLSLHRRN